MTKVTKILFIFSGALNVSFIVFLIFASSQKTSSISFLNMDSDNVSYTTAAAVMSIPSLNADAVFGPLEITLQRGDRAAIQFSAIAHNNQANWVFNTLYDHSIISVEMSGFGIIIKALQPGETSMQTVFDTGIVDIANIKVIE